MPAIMQTTKAISAFLIMLFLSFMLLFFIIKKQCFYLNKKVPVKMVIKCICDVDKKTYL